MLLREQQEVIQAHQGEAPVKVVPIAIALGINVYSVDHWPDNLSGQIVRHATMGGPSGYAIFVNRNHADTRRRFTIAHEIAHFVLHRDLIGDGIAEDGLWRSGLSDWVEAQANRMAADILMPWSLLSPAIERIGPNVHALARQFEVSPSAMSIRLGVPFEY